MSGDAPLRVAVHGALGRMGRELLTRIADAPELELSFALDRGDAADLAQACERAEVVVDFSTPAALTTLAHACARTRAPLVTGTTGLDQAAEEALGRLARQAPVVAAPNFSQGVTLLFHLAALAAGRLGPGFDAEIMELHHRHKVDAPSGTAARLAEVVTQAKGLGGEALVYGREGQVGARPDGEVGVLSLRGGDVVGEHTLIFAGAGERLELVHRATDRAIFARGALRAARWVVDRTPGRYDMADVMGLTSAQ